MDLIARIDELLAQRGWSRYRLAHEANLSESTIFSQKKRGYNPQFSTIESCCNAFGITLAEFFDPDLQDREFTLEERRLIYDWRGLSLEMKDAVQQVISAAASGKKTE